MRIGINCGHTVSGQPGCGAVGYLDESVETRKVGNKLILILSKAGHTVYDCTNDYAPSTSSNLSQIVDMANRQPLDLFVSIHFNSGGGRGTEVFTYSGERHKEAVAVCNALHALGFVNRGVKDGSKLYVVRRSDAKAMLVEVCFVDTADAELYRKIGADAVAKAIAVAITGEKTGREDDEVSKEEFEKLVKSVNEIGAKVTKLEKNVTTQGAGTNMVYNYIDDNMPEWARQPVQWCADKGVIVGTGNGLGLTDLKLWVCVVVYRAAKVIAKLIKVNI